MKEYARKSTLESSFQKPQPRGCDLSVSVFVFLPAAADLRRRRLFLYIGDDPLETLVEALASEGRLLLAGPHPAIDSLEPGEAGFSGSLIVAEFASLEQAQDLPSPLAYRFVAADLVVAVFSQPSWSC